MVLAIDLGSNSARICQMNEKYEIISSKQFMVASALDLKKTGNLTPEAQARIMKALLEFKKEYDFNLPYKAVATEAFRMAKNAKEFFAKVKEESGISFEIISAEEEARLMSLALEHRLKVLKLYKEASLYLDLGGASTELSYESSFLSFKFGIVSFYQKILPLLQSKGKEAKEEIFHEAWEETKEARAFMRTLNFSQLILTSGAPTTVVAVKKNISYGAYKAEDINGETLAFEDLSLVWEKIFQLNHEELNFYFGFERAYLIAAGIALLSALLEENKEKKMLVVDDGLREGVALNLLQNLH